MKLRPTTFKPSNVTAPLRLERRIDGQLWARKDGSACAVTVHRCFPWTEPTRFISLRDKEQNEVALLRDAAELGEASRAALEDALATAGFVFCVQHIRHVEDEIEIRRWTVATREGERSFQTGRDEWPRALPGNAFLIRDVAGDLYHVPDATSLDKKSRELLWAFVE